MKQNRKSIIFCTNMPGHFFSLDDHTRVIVGLPGENFSCRYLLHMLSAYELIGWLFEIFYMKKIPTLLPFSKEYEKIKNVFLRNFFDFSFPANFKMADLFINFYFFALCG